MAYETDTGTTAMTATAEPAPRTEDAETLRKRLGIRALEEQCREASENYRRSVEKRARRREALKTIASYIIWGKRENPFKYSD